jgi:hypothetical protein
VSGNGSSSLLSIIIVVNVLLTIRGETDARVNIGSVELVLCSCLLLFGTWVEGAVIWQLSS